MPDVADLTLRVWHPAPGKLLLPMSERPGFVSDERALFESVSMLYAIEAGLIVDIQRYPEMRMMSGEPATSVWLTLREEMLFTASRMRAFGDRSGSSEFTANGGKDIVAAMHGADTWEELERALGILHQHVVLLEDIARFRVVEQRDADAVLKHPEVTAICPVPLEWGFWRVRQALLRRSYWLPQHCVPCVEQMHFMRAAWLTLHTELGATQAQDAWQTFFGQGEETFAAFLQWDAWEGATFADDGRRIDEAAINDERRKTSFIFSNAHHGFWPTSDGTVASRWLAVAEVKARLKDAHPSIIGDPGENQISVAMAIQLWGNTDARFLLGLEPAPRGSPALLLEEVVCPALSAEAVERAGDLESYALPLSSDIRKRIEADTWPLLGDGRWAHYGLGLL